LLVRFLFPPTWNHVEKYAASLSPKYVDPSIAIERQKADTAPHHAKGEGGKVASVLIIEDSEKMRRMLRTLLADSVSPLWECRDGEEGLAAYRAHHPDFVLMDINMNAIDGLTATREIRTVDPTAKVIMVTSYDQAELREAARDAGAIGYVLKDNLLELVTILKAERYPDGDRDRPEAEDRH
jgi:two-component system, chemotaxis family, chemotaxis protein CheY